MKGRNDEVEHEIIVTLEVSELGRVSKGHWAEWGAGDKGENPCK